MQIPPGLVVEKSAVLVAWNARVPGPRISESCLVTWPADLFDRRVSIMFNISSRCCFMSIASIETLSWCPCKELMLMVATLRLELDGRGIGVGNVVLCKVDTMFSRTAFECIGVSDVTVISFFDLMSRITLTGLGFLRSGCN